MPPFLALILLLLATAFVESTSAHFTVANRGATLDFGRGSTVYSPCWASYAPTNEILYAWFEQPDSAILFVSVLSVDPSTGNVSTLVTTEVAFPSYPPEISCTLGDGIAVVGDPTYFGDAQVYVFDHPDPTTLTMNDQFAPNNLGLPDGFYFGAAVALSDDGSTIFAGTPDDGLGKVYVLSGRWMR
jgi:hypothetical protein